MKKTMFYRGLFYVSGLLILALGLSLNTKAGLGVSAIISVSYAISAVTGISFGNTTLGLYILFIAVELVLHGIREKRYRAKSPEALKHANKTNRKLIFLMDILQFPLSIVFTRFLNLFSNLIPPLYTEGDHGIGQYAFRLVMVTLAIIITGIGAAMSLAMRIVPNPGDGIVQAVADCIQKDVGFTKNCMDVVNITVAAVIGICFAGRLEGVGIGTVMAVIGVGRSMAVFNRLTYKKMTELAGIEQ